MAFFEKVGETLSTKGKEAAHRAKDVADLAKLNTQLGQLEGKIRTYYQIIGEKVYQNEKDQEHAGLEAEFDLINDAAAEIARIKKQISDIKGTKECGACSAEVDNSFAYCPHCGAKFEEPVEEPAEECGSEESAEECGCEEPAEECGCEESAEECGSEEPVEACGCEETAEACACGEDGGESAEEECRACEEAAPAEESREACAKAETAE